MKYRWSVSYESDTQPVHTQTATIETDSMEEAIRRGLFRASRPKGKFRSLVVVVEGLAAEREEITQLA